MDHRAKQGLNNVPLLRIILICWLAAKLISWKLWMEYRLYPMVPVFEFTSLLSGAVHQVLFGLSLLSLLFLGLFPDKKKIALVVFSQEILLCLLDQTRWQPWEYFYLLFLIAFCFDTSRQKRQLSIAILVGCCYAFSGLHKLNIGFLDRIWHNLFLNHYLELSKDQLQSGWLYYSGSLLAIIEISLGIGVLFFKQKRLFVLAAILMHLLILLVIGPFGLHHNAVVWPWNVALIGMNLYLLGSDQTLRIPSFSYRPVALLVLLCGFLPMLSFIGLWPNYLSWNLYSGSSVRAELCLSQSFTETKPYVLPNATSGCEAVPLKKLALDELGVPPYPEKNYFLKLEKQWNAKYPAAKAELKLLEN